MKTPNKLTPSNEREALQWLIPALDRPLQNIPNLEFKKAWSALFYLYGGLNPDETGDHGNGISMWDDGSDRFRVDRTTVDRTVLCSERMASGTCTAGG
ncbi:MAG: hypothetical protein IPO87_18845 [Flavobacteriales bacterium]|nr:hypothetical protein [Flavobacteriales bacterium]